MDFINYVLGTIGSVGTVVLLCMAGAIWRYWDGSDFGYTGSLRIFNRTLVRLIPAVIIAATATQVGIDWYAEPLISLAVTALAVLSLHMGFTEGRDKKFKMVRYMAPALVIATLTALTGTFFLVGVGYVVACGAAGYSYTRIPENLARLPMGATLGLLALL